MRLFFYFLCISFSNKEICFNISGMLVDLMPLEKLLRKIKQEYESGFLKAMHFFISLLSFLETLLKIPYSYLFNRVNVTDQPCQSIHLSKVHNWNLKIVLGTFLVSNQRCIWNSVKHLGWSLFAKIVNSRKLLTIFSKKGSIVDVWQSPKYTSDNLWRKSLILTEKFLLSSNIGHMIRSSCREVFCKKNVLRNFAKFTGKHLCQSLLFNKVAVF